ncbi:MAG: tetratricopeptide repeat protein [Brumimicrobium sp.]|nr:tetratricopeptide repeat protein [Brumimicrobium sp.]MCO5268408.1 tetratricopeptide repeat protein [Brumimicrobium sp.]
MSDYITKEELLEQFKGNKILKISTYAVGAAVLIVLVVLAYQKFISGPKNEASKAEIADGIMYMEKDSTQAAIDEFEYLAKEYKGYAGGKISSYALGNLYFEQGKYEEALNELKKVKIDDTYLMTLAIGTQGDCYSELGDYKNAVKKYIEAAERVENDATTPVFYFKAGLNAEEAGDYQKAAEYYRIIKNKYLTFANQKQIEKYITRAENSIVE